MGFIENIKNLVKSGPIAFGILVALILILIMFTTLTTTSTINKFGGMFGSIVVGICVLIALIPNVAEYRFISKPEVIKLINRGVPFDKLDETYKAERDQ